jgi:hypothetical protein
MLGQGVGAVGPAPAVARDPAAVYVRDGAAQVVVAPGGAAAAAIAAAAGLEVSELGALLSPTCRHDNIIGLLGVVPGSLGRAQMLVLELAQVRGGWPVPGVLLAGRLAGRQAGP